MTDNEKRDIQVILTVVSLFVLALTVTFTIWHVQHDDLGQAWLWGILTIIPAVGLYEALRRWNRG